MNIARKHGWFAVALGLVLCGTIGAASISIPNTPDGTLLTIVKSLSNDQPEVIWISLPAKYQADVRGILTDLGGKLDKELHDKSFTVLDKVVQLLREKRDYILGLPFLQGPIAEKREQIVKAWPAGVDLIDTIVKSELRTVEGIKSLDPEKFLAGTGSKLMKQGRAVAEAIPPSSSDQEGKKMLDKISKLKDAKVTVVSNDGTKAVVHVEAGDEKKDLNMTNVDGKWVCDDMIANWDKSIAEAKQNIAKMDPQQTKMSVLPMLGMVEATLDQLIAAKSQEEFTMTVMQVAAMFGGGGAPGGGPGH